MAERPERLELGGAFTCPACGAGIDPFRLVRFEEPPSTLANQLVRFKSEGARWAKSHVPARCPRHLRFPPAWLQGVGGAQASFELRTALLHVGDIEAGHFKAVACWHGEWWLCDDARAKLCGSDELTGASADTYVVVYSRAGSGRDLCRAAPTGGALWG